MITRHHAVDAHQLEDMVGTYSGINNVDTHFITVNNQVLDRYVQNLLHHALREGLNYSGFSQRVGNHAKQHRVLSSKLSQIHSQ